MPATGLRYSPIFDCCWRCRVLGCFRRQPPQRQPASALPGRLALNIQITDRLFSYDRPVTYLVTIVERATTYSGRGGTFRIRTLNRCGGRGIAIAEQP